MPGFSSLYDAIHGWKTGRMDGWTGHVMKKASLKNRAQHPLLYVISLQIFHSEKLQCKSDLLQLSKTGTKTGIQIL
jgi:hypothetical protein